MSIALLRSCEEYQTIRSYKHISRLNGASFLFYIAGFLVVGFAIAYSGALFTPDSKTPNSRLNFMTVKSDRWIRRMCEEAQLIHPFEARLVREVAGTRIISAGASSYGYDMRLADDGFRVFSPIHGREIDPKHFDDESLIEPTLRTADDGSKYYLMPPHSYALGVSVETFKMPRNVTGICMGKSTYARAGLAVNTTPLEAGWVGRLVIELGNLADLPLRVYVNEGIGQVLFFESDEDCDTSYEDRGGKYQGQTGLTYSRL